MFVRLHIYIMYAFRNTTALKLQRIHTCVSDAVELDIDVSCQCYTYLLLCFIVLYIFIEVTHG